VRLNLVKYEFTKMKYYFSLLCLLAFSINGLSQALPTVNLCLGDDATVCQGQPVVITNCGAGGGSGAAGINLNAPTSISLWDDVWSGSVSIGFPFSFYGNTYNNCVIGSNGLVSFDLSKANGYCAWSLGGVGALPNAGFFDAKNSAMGCYQDMNPGMGGTIQYQTIGTAPNRMFVVLYKEVPMFSCGLCTYMAIILHETSNNVEFHIGNKPPCNSWNGGLAIQGNENAAGTVAHITPGRNNSQWSANQEGKRFTPTAPSNTSAYTITTVPYLLVTSPGASYLWQNTLGQTFPYNGGVLNVNTVPPGTTGYFLTGSACGVGIGSVTNDTTWLTRVNSSVTATSTPDICSSGIGTVTATPGAGTAPFTFNWPTLGQATPTVTNVPAGTYTVQMTDSYGCPSSANVTVGDTPASFNGTTTVVSCPGGSDGTATANMVPVLGNVTYQWDDPAMQTTQTATGLAAGTYNCVVTSDIGCSGTVTLSVTEIPGMIATITNQTDVTCNSGNDGMIEITVTQGTPVYTYSWNNSVSTTNIASDLFVGNHTITITDANGCIVNVYGTLGQPTPLSITTLTSPTQICPEDDIQLDVAGTGGSSAYTFTWSENGTIIGTGTSITVDPQFTNTQYCVILSEVCGSPTHDSCTVITFPVPINASITPDHVEDCIPGFFEFTNSSSNGGEIATTYFEFSDGNSYMEVGNDSTSNLFIVPNFYSANMTITSIYGCVYTGTFNNLIEVKPLPIADFTFSSNPATFFETSIQLQDRSSVDVIDWNWISPGSSPTYSYSANPAFTFPEGEVGDYPVTLIVTTEYGCTDTVTFIMHIVQDVIFYAPNSFTPDNDEHNQSWEIFVSGIDIYHFDLFIFDRWGEIIWESHDPSAKWDGTYNGEYVQAGTYVWKASAKDALNDGKYEFNGYINILK
jgi:gliding motility-associated-like protein